MIWADHAVGEIQHEKFDAYRLIKAVNPHVRTAFCGAALPICLRIYHCRGGAFWIGYQDGKVMSGVAHRFTRLEEGGCFYFNGSG